MNLIKPKVNIKYETNELIERTEAEEKTNSEVYNILFNKCVKTV